jgi:hypothetical protein
VKAVSTAISIEQRFSRNPVEKTVFQAKTADNTILCLCRVRIEVLNIYSP